jgi:hypothetical protein
MSDPRDFERDPNMAGNRYAGRESSDGTSSGWIIAAVIAVILVGLAAYGYRGTEQVSSNTPETTSGQSTRAPVPSTPPAAPVAPAPRPASPQ